MGQINAIRVQFSPREIITSTVNSAVQTLAFTGYLEVGDVIDILEVDSTGTVLSTVADNVTILAINPDTSITLGTSVDTSGLTGTPIVYAQPIDDVQEAIDRLYRNPFGKYFPIQQDIGSCIINSPSAGQTTYFVDDISFFRAGDTVSVISDEGLAGTATILSVNPNADDTGNKASIVINQVIDTSALTNPVTLNTSITTMQAIERLRGEIDLIDRPIENEDGGIGDGKTTVFFTSNLFVPGTSKVLIDGVRKKLGTAGTRGTLTKGTANASLIFTSVVLGTQGSKNKVAVVSAAGNAITVTGNYNAGYTVSINNSSGASTAATLAALLNADPVVKTLFQTQYGGTGADAVVAFSATALAGGLDTGTGDYAELSQVYNNLITTTGYKLISFHIRPNERNRMNTPPQDDESLTFDYRRPMDNI